MKVKAYRCNYCGLIKEEEAIVGIVPIEDMFDRLKSYPICKDPDKTDVHGCTDCYKALMRNADSINKRKYEHLYIKEREEAGYMFRSGCVTNHRNKTFTPPKENTYKNDPVS